MDEKYLYYVQPEIPKPKWGYTVGAVIASSAQEAVTIGETFGENCRIISGPYKLSKEWKSNGK